MAQERLPGLHSGAMTTLTKGDPMSRSMGQYGKGHSFVPATPRPEPGAANKGPQLVPGGAGYIGGDNS